MKFKEFLTESREGKLTHLEHVEDRALHSREGAEHALNALRGVGDSLEGSPGPRVTTKFDGSPTVLFGHHPETGKFFVATKAGFSKTPKINYTPEDIEKNHPQAIHEKLKAALEHLPKVAPHHGVFQGDFMYHHDSVHESPKHYNFTPNTLMYSVKKDSPEGKKVKNARIGVAVHTQYHGHDFDSMKASFNPELSKFKEHKDVHIINPEVTIDKVQKGSHRNALKQAEQSYLAVPPHAWDVTGVHRNHMQSYIHSTSKQGVKPTAPGFKQFLKTRFQKEAEKLSSDRGKLNKMKALVQHHSHVDEHHDSYESVLNLHHHLQQAKKAMLPVLNKNNPYETSVKGNKVESGEGFVVHHNDVPSKLVDREQFTKANMEAHGMKEAVLVEGYPSKWTDHEHIGRDRWKKHIEAHHGSGVTYKDHKREWIHALNTEGKVLGHYDKVIHHGVVFHKPWNPSLFEETIVEGGNIQVGEHKPEPIHPDEHADVKHALFHLHKSYFEKHSKHLFGKGGHALHEHSAFSGSTHAFMKGLHKHPVGDIDTMVNNDQSRHLEEHLKNHKHFGNYSVVGTKKHGREISALMKHKGTGKVHQFDFEHVNYSNDEPTPSETFSHSSHHEDLAKGIKGVHHKALLHAVAHTQGKKFSITHGLRSKDAPKDEEGMRDPDNISHSLFKTKSPDIHSFHGVTRLIKNHIPSEHHKAIHDKFKEVLQHVKANHKPALEHLESLA